MKTKRQEELMQIREDCFKKNSELDDELRAIYDKAREGNGGLTDSESHRVSFIRNYMRSNLECAKEMGERLSLYDVVLDCLDTFFEQMQSKEQKHED